MEESGFFSTFPPLFVRSVVLGSGAWRFQRDLGGMKSPILGPGFGIGQETDCTGVCRPFRESPGPGFWAPPRQIGVRWASPRRERVRTRVLGSTPADRSQVGFA
ncbi:unnamed protein product [Staurois parvus]|uniref:Uncharacterized protein n=1 Tax=Staurois parvus TaxID=386267 RepID=A0ABN9BSM8_9NEOB|nr:unnamed protein product [Staurois parvus]